MVMVRQHTMGQMFVLGRENLQLMRVLQSQSHSFLMTDAGLSL